MATTTRLGLAKPAASDLVSIDTINANSDLIDAAVGAKVVTSGTRPSTPFNGQVIYQTDTQTTHIYVSATSTWKDVAAGASIVTSSTRPASPYTGQLIHETDTHKTYVYSAGWVLVADATIDVSNVVRSANTRTVFYQSTDPTSGMVAGDIRVWA